MRVQNDLFFRVFLPKIVYVSVSRYKMLFHFLETEPISYQNEKIFENHFLFFDFLQFGVDFGSFLAQEMS